MSADNYLYVAPRGDRFVVVMRFASFDYPLDVEDREHVYYESRLAENAVAQAHRHTYEDIVEYGVSLHPAVRDAFGDDE